MEEPGQKRRLWFGWLMFLILLLIVTYGLIRLTGNVQVIRSDQPGLYRVIKFDDGDTIVVDMNGTNETVRFIGVDTPETHKPNTPIQCFGPDAAAFTKRFIGSNHVRLEADPLDTNRDRYGRLLRYVFLPDGTLVDEKLITEGYGFAYTHFPFERSVQFQLAELRARQAQRGLWQACRVKIESTGQKQTQYP